MNERRLNARVHPADRPLLEAVNLLPGMRIVETEAHERGKASVICWRRGNPRLNGVPIMSLEPDGKVWEIEHVETISLHEVA